jgi:hypothetical protein
MRSIDLNMFESWHSLLSELVRDTIQISNTYRVFEVLVIEECHCWSQITHRSIELSEIYRLEYVRKLALTSQRIGIRYHRN